ncbi:MAG: hypothetical protein Sylvanvirus7_11 [Sylvanvirus sp.]|uniref:Uncharacterized protein n=1 Tax=Sylvanvirus sp. TaxID=2487774 RepID=A0A3G5AKF0_9VIRU|nr:MAG: hypothetical protein Sylvanvirus7_11 [Sylvanvirus sp.]
MNTATESVTNNYDSTTTTPSAKKRTVKVTKPSSASSLSQTPKRLKNEKRVDSVVDLNSTTTSLQPLDAFSNKCHQLWNHKAQVMNQVLQAEKNKIEPPLWTYIGFDNISGRPLLKQMPIPPLK